MRLDKLLSEMGIASRKDVKKAAAKGALLVDGVPVRDTSVHIDPERVTVTYFGKVIEYRKYTYVLLNKPDGGQVVALRYGASARRTSKNGTFPRRQT